MASPRTGFNPWSDASLQASCSTVTSHYGQGPRTLADLQTSLYRLITAPGGVEEALANESALHNCALEAIIAGNKGLSVHDRIGIYANAYFYRLLDVFKEDFSCIYNVLGDTDFHNLITGYLIEYPSTEPSLLYAGRRLADYLKTGRQAGKPVLQFPFLADLARLERVSAEAFHGADAGVLDEASLRSLAPEAWPALRMRLHPAAHILDIEWRVDTLMTAIKEGRQWEPPERSPVAILVWRHEWRVRYRVLEPGERAALKAAACSTDFASICGALAIELESAAGVTDLAPIINRLFTGWLRDGILTSASADVHGAEPA